MPPFAVKSKCIHYVVVGSPLTFCGIDMRGRDFWIDSGAPVPDEFTKVVLSLPLCKRCGKAHLKQMEVAMGVGQTWENTP